MGMAPRPRLAAKPRFLPPPDREPAIGLAMAAAGCGNVMVVKSDEDARRQDGGGGPGKPTAAALGVLLVNQ